METRRCNLSLYLPEKPAAELSPQLKESLMNCWTEHTPPPPPPPAFPLLQLRRLYFLPPHLTAAATAPSAVVAALPYCSAAAAMSPQLRPLLPLAAFTQLPLPRPLPPSPPLHRLRADQTG